MTRGASHAAGIEEEEASTSSGDMGWDMVLANVEGAGLTACSTPSFCSLTRCPLPAPPPRTLVICLSSCLCVPKTQLHGLRLDVDRPFTPVSSHHVWQTGGVQ